MEYTPDKAGGFQTPFSKRIPILAQSEMNRRLGLNLPEWILRKYLDGIGFSQVLETAVRLTSKGQKVNWDDDETVLLLVWLSLES